MNVLCTLYQIFEILLATRHNRHRYFSKIWKPITKIGCMATDRDLFDHISWELTFREFAHIIRLLLTSLSMHERQEGEVDNASETE